MAGDARRVHQDVERAERRKFFAHGLDVRDVEDQRLGGMAGCRYRCDRFAQARLAARRHHHMRAGFGKGCRAAEPYSGRGACDQRPSAVQAEARRFGEVHQSAASP